MAYEFTAEYNWCDRRCERCPLVETCVVAVRERGRLWQMKQRGQDPDDIGVALEYVTEDLESALRMLEETAAEDGISLDDFEDAPLPPTSLVDRRLQDASLDHVRAVDALVAVSVEAGGDDEDDPGRQAASAAFQAATTIGMKLARVGTYTTPPGADGDDGDDGDDGVWGHDAVPNLLLVEHYDVAVGRWAEELAETDRGRYAEFVRARTVLRRLVQPWLDAVPAAAREELRRRIEEGRAPSPYCTVAPRPLL